jgi:AcrR family transcriptional regulator
MVNSHMTFAPPDALKPRKLPRQGRSKVTTDAIFEATIQVLMAHGARGMKTTLIAERAGVSVGTVYQYFPHKEALLYAVTQRYLEELAQAVERCAEIHRGEPIEMVSDALVSAYVNAKSARSDVSLALYRASGDMDTDSLVSSVFARLLAATIELFSSAPDADFDNIEEVAFTVFSAVAGGTRVVFENNPTPQMLQQFRLRMCSMCRAYLRQTIRPELGTVGA